MAAGPLRQSETTVQLGDLVGDRFRILELAAEGGMGAVYRARDEETSAEVALKLMHADSAAHAERFAREALLLAELRHPAIVQYVAHGRSGAGELYLAMEWLEGVDLAARLRRGRLTVAESVHLVTRIAAALGAVHARGAAHRDVKPSNLFLPGGDVLSARLLDFGIARLAPESSFTRTATGVVLGSPRYMSPEQTRGLKEADARTDVFSLGCVLYECLTGRPAFAGDHLVAILAKILLEEVPRPSEDCPGVPEALDALLARMLAKAPDERPANGAEVERALLALPLEAASPAPRRERPAALTEGEQRLVSVVVVATPQAGDRASAAHAETVPAAASDAENTGAREACERHGARLEKLADGSFVALVLGVGAATDQAAQAARCALSLRSVFPDRALALVTGGAVVRGALPVGDAVDRAVRLVGPCEAPARSLRVDDVTAALIASRFEVAMHGAIACLVEERAGTAGAGTLLGRATPCVGRERELSQLAATWAECVGESVARALLVTGPPGVGKSRLLYEFSRSLSGGGAGASEQWLAQGDPMSAAAPFGMVAQVIRQAAGLRAGESPDERRAKLVARVARHVPAADVARVADFLGECIGAPATGDGGVQLTAARRDPRLMGDQVRRAFEDWIVAECAAGPRLVVLEDIHWGDWPTLQLLDGALKLASELPLMVLAFARPEVHESFPKLWAARAVQELRVAELSRRASERFVREVLGPAADAGVVERVVAHAGGHALFLEELVRSVREGRDDTFPPTVLAMVQARLERLPADTRKVLRGASVFGQAFWRGGLAALLGVGEARLDELLHDAVERELIVPVASSRFAGDSELAFHHALTREAAYATLTDDDRRLGHRLAGAYLQAAGEPDAAVLAEHFVRGEEPERARREFLRAAEHALEGLDLEAVIARAERGAACGAAGEQLGALRALQADAHFWRGEIPQAAARAAEARALLSPASRWWWSATKSVALAGRATADRAAVTRVAAELEAMTPDEGHVIDWAVTGYEALPPLLQLGERAAAASLTHVIERVVVARRVRDTTVAAFEARIAGFEAGLRGDAAAAVRWALEAAARFELAGNRRRAVTEKVNQTANLNQLGQYERAIETARGAIRDADRLGLHEIGAITSVELALALLGSGDAGDAERVVGEALALFRAHDHLYWKASSERVLGQVLLAKGDLAGAASALGRSCELFLAIPVSRAFSLALLSRARLALGDSRAALELATEARAIADTEGPLEIGELGVRLAYAEALHAGGRVDEASAALVDAHARLSRAAAQLDDAELREGFLTRVPDNARILSLASAWGLRQGTLGA
jgi:tetratricopeptide (TPR) repeat protein